MTNLVQLKQKVATLQQPTAERYWILVISNVHEDNSETVEDNLLTRLASI